MSLVESITVAVVATGICSGEYHIRNQNLLNCEAFRWNLDCQRSCRSFSFPKSSKELCSLDSTSSSLQPSKWSINHPDGFFTLHHLLLPLRLLQLIVPLFPKVIWRRWKPALFVFCWHPNPKGFKGSEHFSHPFPTRGTAATYCCIAEGWKSNGNNLKEPAVFNWLSSCTDMIEWHTEMLLLMHFSYLAWLANTWFTWTCIMLRSKARRTD